jgi:hypothetical protein
MTSIARRALATAVAATAALSLALAGTSSAQAREAAADANAETTALTIKIRSCEGCEVTLISYLDEDPQHGWSSDAHVIQNGKAAFVVPTERTLGMSVMVHTPWEGHLGYTTMAVMRYQGLTVGDRIGFNRARTMKKASGCFAGTTEKTYTLRLKVRRVQLDGVFEKVPGQIVFAPTTREWLRPIYRVYGGVLGGNDVILCKAGSHGGRIAS